MWVDFVDVEAENEARAAEAIQVARGYIEELIIWLGWSEWDLCETGCILGVRCLILCFFLVIDEE